MRQVLPQDHFIVCAAVPPDSWNQHWIPFRHAEAHVDLVNLLGYKLNASSEVTGHQSQLYSLPNPSFHRRNDNIADAVRSLNRSGMPYRKMLISVPTFGLSYLGASGDGQAYHGMGGRNGIFQYRELPRRGATENVDISTGTCWSVGGDGGFVSHDNPDTVGWKGLLIKWNGLAGLLFSDVTEDVSTERSLIMAGYCQLKPGCSNAS